jgi:penicillin-binding protein 1A
VVLSPSGRVQLADENAVGQIVGGDMAWASASHRLTQGDLVFVEPAAGGGLHLRQIPLANGAIVAMEPYSGRVLAMVGGYSFSKNKFNRATQAWRQPGSSFKPFVYAAALESGQFTPASIVLDAPISLAGGGGDNWSPENYEHTFHGPLVFRRGLELSLNTMTVRIAMQTKMATVVDTAKRFGIVDKMEPVLPMALGAGVTTPLRMAGAYSALVNGGRKVTPHLIEVVSDRNGKPLARADRRECGSCRAPFGGQDAPELAPPGEQLINPITAYQIDTMLEGVVQRGTAVAARSLGRPIGGKTGTTNDYRSAWFVGFTPQIVVAVYVGRDDNVSLGEGETGAQAALPIFINFMRDAEKDLPPKDFVAPPDTRFAFVGPNREAFRPGSEPKVIATPVQTDAEKAAELAVTPINLPGKPIQAAPPPVVDRPPKPASDVNGLF